MGIIIGILIAIATLAVCFVLIFANGMSDAPMDRGFSIWPVFLTGMAISAICIGTHFFPVHW